MSANDSGSMSESLERRFASLAVNGHLKAGTKKYRAAKERFIVQEFEIYFGEDSKLLNWQRLCGDLGLDDPLPGSIRQCRKALNKVWVNIWDLLEATGRGERVKIWPSQKALAVYTKRTSRFYPREKAKECGPVRALLAHIV